MKLTELVTPDHVQLAVEMPEGSDVLSLLAEPPAAGLGRSVEAIAGALRDREALGSTAVGEGFAIPHCKVTGLKQVSVWLTGLAEGVDFGAGDGMPVDFFVTVLSPPDQPAAHLQILPQVARLLKSPEVRSHLRNAREPAAVVATIREATTPEEP